MIPTREIGRASRGLSSLRRPLEHKVVVVVILVKVFLLGLKQVIIIFLFALVVVNSLFCRPSRPGRPLSHRGGKDNLLTGGKEIILILARRRERGLQAPDTPQR